MEKRLQDFIQSIQSLSDIRNLDSFNPIVFQIEHPITATRYTVVGSKVEPSYLGIPINATWVVLDPSDAYYLQALKLKDVLDVDTVSNKTVTPSGARWHVLRAYDDIFKDPQFYSGTGQTGPVGPTGPAGAVGQIGPAGQAGTSGSIATPLTIKNVVGHYIAVAEDMQNSLIRVDSPVNSDSHLVLPNDATVDCRVGTSLMASTSGLGRLTISAQTGALVKSPQSLTIDRKYGRVTIIKTAPNLWEVDGQLMDQVPFEVLPMDAEPTQSVVYFTDHNPTQPNNTLRTTLVVSSQYFWVDQEVPEVVDKLSRVWETGPTGNQWCYGNPEGLYFKASIIDQDPNNPPVLLAIGPTPQSTGSYLENEWCKLSMQSLPLTQPKWIVDYPLDNFREYSLQISVAETPDDATILNSFTVRLQKSKLYFFTPNFGKLDQTVGLDLRGYRGFTLDSYGHVYGLDWVGGLDGLGNQYQQPYMDLCGSLIQSIYETGQNLPPYAGSIPLYNTFFSVSGPEEGGTGTHDTQYNADGIADVSFGLSSMSSGIYTIHVYTDITESIATVITGRITLGI